MSFIAVINGHSYDTDNFYTAANPYAYAAAPPTLGLQQLMVDLATVAAGIAAAAAAGGAFVGAVSMGSTLTVAGTVTMKGQSRVTTDALGAGLWFDGNSTASKAFLGMDASSNTSFRLFAAAAGINSVTVTLTTGGWQFGSPSGGDKGGGTINAAGSIYVNNSALTCFGVEHLADGAVDLAKWDGYAVSGRHDIAHEFVALTQSGFDPRDPEQYIAKMMADRALPGMPSQATWRPNDHSLDELQMRAWLATELLASAWVGAHRDHERRITALENSRIGGTPS